MKILLTGASGYLGSQLSRALRAAGHELTILQRSTSDLSRIADILPAVHCFNLEGDGMRAAFAGGPYDAIVHTATCYGRERESLGELLEVNVAWPLRLLELAISTRCGLFINSDTALDRMVSPYALTKKQFRDWGSFVAGNEPIRFLNLELEHFYGAGDDEAKFVTHVIRSCLRNVAQIPLTSGEQQRDFIHIDDVVAAYLLLLQTEIGGARGFYPYSVGSGQLIAVRELVTMIKSLSAASTCLDFGAIPLRANEAMASQADITELRRLGWKPTINLVEGLSRAIVQERDLLERAKA